MSHNKIPADLIKIHEARALLGVSPAKMAQILRNHILTIYQNPLDARVKLVSKAEVRALQIPKQAEAA